MALSRRAPQKQPKGQTKPRLAPPMPARHRGAEMVKLAAELGYELMPWQEYASRFLTATGPQGWLYREVAIVVARRNGKTKLLLPRILMALRAGESILHTAQDRALPRELFEELADKLTDSPEVKYIRWANGQETIRFVNGGRYTLVAPNHGVRGRDADLIVVDEVREQHDDRLARAILPTFATSKSAQIVYLSNAGDEASVLLNDLRDRKDDAGRLAYLEWSAEPERAIDDLTGWAEANPALGYTLTVEALQELRESLTDPAFETEHLCRWVASMRERLVDDKDWQACRVDDVGKPQRPAMGISLAPEGDRASVVIAWQRTDGSIAIQVLFDVTGHIALSEFGEEVRKTALKLGVRKVGFDSITDRELAKFIPVAKPLVGTEFTGASGNFATKVKAREIAWDDADVITTDLIWTGKKDHDMSGAYQAVRASGERPITAALAAIRAVSLASGPRLGQARIC